ncbi:hypothetical protein EAH75_05170 [Rhodanobacter glycinis]|uniref:hypothetical protein n=1 Tax=Rhodanobacter glycinis TaxID=582702 RepID=UPI001127DC42|nr:hypothetical protein [Rhodanobacter glycinis]TPG50813.1 hypothetical protein EAH75_05170 [Rhodanobacter glycinis]
MSSLWTDLLFLHGHITDPQLARRLLPPPPPTGPDPPHPAATPMPLLQQLARRLCLGIGDGMSRTQ